MKPKVLKPAPMTKRAQAERLLRVHLERFKRELEKRDLKGYAGYAVRAIVKKGRI